MSKPSRANLSKSSAAKRRQSAAADTNRSFFDQAFEKAGGVNSSPIQTPANPKIGLTDSRGKMRVMPFPKALSISTGLHLLSPFLVLGLIALVLLLLQINPWDWFKRPAKKPDMTFVLVRDTNAKSPENAKFRGEFNQRAGGKRNPDEDLAPPEKITSASKAVQQQAKPQTNPTPPQPAQKPKPQQTAQPPRPKPQEQPKPEEAKEKAPPAPKPSFKPTIPMPAKAEQAKPMEKKATQTGPITQPRNPSQAAPASNPTPVQIASQGALSASTPSSVAHNFRGNSQGGKETQGVDVASDDNLGPILADLQRRIRRNWVPPRDAHSKRIHVDIVIARDGRLVRRAITRSSGSSLADEAALRSVDVSAPFRPFPPSIPDNQVTIDFSFDYNVLLQPKSSR